MNTRPMTLMTATGDAVARAADVDAAPGRARGKIRRADEPRVLVEVRQDLALVPAVIAAGHHLNAVAEQIVGEVGRDAESGRRVFAVGDDEVDLVMPDEGGQAPADQLAAGLADDVADEEQPGHPRSTGTSIVRSAPILDARHDDAQLSGL